MIIDLIFRKGSSHSNHSTDYIDIVRDIVKLIRKKYDKNVSIIINTDSGFFDQKAFDYFEQELKIHYVCTGTLYPTLKANITKLKKPNQELIDDKESPLFNSYEKGNQVWSYVEFGSKLVSWNTFRRKLINFAVKIVSHSREKVLQVVSATCNNLNIYHL